MFTTAYIYDDVINKTVVDLGCGTGRLAIGAALLGARETLGVDVDKAAVKMAQKNARKLNVKELSHWIAGDIDVVHGLFDTVLQNPPFGVQRRKADRKFIEKSLQLAHRIYSLHKASEGNREFIKRFIEKRGGKVMSISTLEMYIPKLFKFHTKRIHRVKVDLYQIEGKVT